MSALSDDDHRKFLAECLKVLEEKYKTGDNGAILVALYQCFIMNRSPPEWLRAAFIVAYENVTGFKVKSWDQVFGRPHPKRARFKRRMEHRDLRYPVAVLVHQFEVAGEPIGRLMFEEIAKILKRAGALMEVGLTDIGGGTVDDIFYKYGGKEIYESIKPFFPIPSNDGKVEIAQDY